MLFWIFLEENYQKTIFIFEINALKFAKMQIFVQNKKNQLWDQKCLFWVFLWV